MKYIETITEAETLSAYVYCMGGEPHNYNAGQCKRCGIECDHVSFDAEIEDDTFYFSGSHATGGVSGTHKGFSASCGNCQAELELPDPPDYND